MKSYYHKPILRKLSFSDILGLMDKIVEQYHATHTFESIQLVNFFPQRGIPINDPRFGLSGNTIFAMEIVCDYVREHEIPYKPGLAIDVFQLCDAVARGDKRRVIKILETDASDLNPGSNLRETLYLMKP